MSVCIFTCTVCDPLVMRNVLCILRITLLNMLLVDVFFALDVICDKDVEF